MSTWINRLHGEKFIFFDLKSKGERGLAVASGLFGFGSCMAGVYANIFNLTSGALLMGGISTVFFLARLVERNRKLTDYEIEENPKLIEKIEKSEPCKALKDAGFKKELILTVFHKGKPETILRSPSVDAFLRKGGPFLEEISPPSKLQELLERQADILEKLLRCKIAKSNLGKKQFINENKLSLLSDPFDNKQLKVARGSYYRSYLSNDWTGLRLVTHGARPSAYADGLNWFPSSDKTNEIVGIENAPLGNHLGVSTVAITRDGKLTLWRQSPLAQHSSLLIAPTGSGSVDWSDFEKQNKPITLGELAKYAMERELTEESFGAKLRIGREHISDTMVLGYFRWLRRGGLPQCVGVTRLRVDEHELTPDIREVDEHEDFTEFLCQPASNKEELIEAVARLKNHESLSLPLYVALTALIEALDADEPGLNDLLFGKL